MGVDLSSLNFLISYKQYIRGNTLQIGRQGLHYAGPWADRTGERARISNEIFAKNGIKFTAEETVNGGDGHTEKLFRMLGAKTVDTLDYSPYENATIIHDMNIPVSEDLHDKFDFIFDSGTMEHIFDVKTVTDNIKNMLRVGGVFSVVTPCNNCAGHGFYQFSPELFRTVFSEEAGYKTISVELAEIITGENFRVLQIPTPRKGDRQEFKTSGFEHYLCFITEKVQQVKKDNFQQSDYLKIWGEMK